MQKPKQRWSPKLVATIRTHLAGNTRLDLLTWANRVKRNPPSKTELEMAMFVLQIDERKNA